MKNLQLTQAYHVKYFFNKWNSNIQISKKCYSKFFTNIFLMIKSSSSID